MSFYRLIVKNGTEIHGLKAIYILGKYFLAFFPFSFAAFSTTSAASSSRFSETSHETESGMKNQRSGVSSIRALVQKSTKFAQLNWKTTFKKNSTAEKYLGQFVVISNRSLLLVIVTCKQSEAFSNL